MDIYRQQGVNTRKTWLLMSLFFVVVIAIGWIFSYVYESPNILYFAVIFSIGMNFFSYWYSDKIVLKISGAIPADRESYFELWNAVENLSITAGLPMPKLYVINDTVPNAFATGRNKENSAVAVTTGLLRLLNKSELEGVIAHEMSHIGNKDILISTVIVVLVGFITLLSDIFLRSSLFGGRNREDGRAQAIMILVGVVFAILSPFIAVIIQLAISRKREFLADASGALLTRYPEGLASALGKISAHSGKMRKANNAMAHLYISNPFGPQKEKNFWTKLFMTHPSTEERIRALRGENVKV